MFKKILSILIFLQILIIAALGTLNYYLYTSYKAENVTYIDQRIDITDNTISNVQAEELSLDSLVKKNSKPRNINQAHFINSDQSDINPVVENIQYTFKLTKSEDSLQVEVVSDLKEDIIPLFFTDLNSGTLPDQQVINVIYDAIIDNELKEIDIDVSITNKVNNIEDVLRELAKLTVDKNIKINVGLPPKWSDVMDYDYLAPVSNFYKSAASISVINNLSNKVRIHAYGYTTINSNSVGPITKNDWAENIIQYYIYKGINPSKTTLVINNITYKWPNREITDNYVDNYVLSTQQVEVLNASQLEAILSSTNITVLNNYQLDDNIAQIGTGIETNYIVYPKHLSQNYLIELAKSYNLNSYILKSY